MIQRKDVVIASPLCKWPEALQHLVCKRVVKGHVRGVSAFLGWNHRKTGAVLDSVNSSPSFKSTCTCDPSMYAFPCRVPHRTRNLSPSNMDPCIRPRWLMCGSIGSLTWYWRAVASGCITNPPADFIAPVEPIAVQTRRPLDRQ